MIPRVFRLNAQRDALEREQRATRAFAFGMDGACEEFEPRSKFAAIDAPEQAPSYQRALVLVERGSMVA